MWQRDEDISCTKHARTPGTRSAQDAQARSTSLERFSATCKVTNTAQGPGDRCPQCSAKYPVSSVRESVAGTTHRPENAHSNTWVPLDKLYRSTTGQHPAVNRITFVGHMCRNCLYYGHPRTPPTGVTKAAGERATWQGVKASEPLG